MSELTVTVRVPIPKHPSLGALERTIFTAVMIAGRELLLQAFSRLEETALTGARQRRRHRYLLTRFGELRFFRWQTRTEGGYGYPLDEALGLAPGAPCSAWVRQTAAWLAQAHPYRQAARLLGKMIGAPVDHRRLWGWVQGSGRAVRRHLEQLRSSLFDDGEVPRFAGPAPKIVTTSADGTFIRTRDGPVEVKLGMWWTGAHLQSPRAVHRKFLLQGKGSYASTEGADRFGQTFYALAAHRAGISKAEEVFFISDGAGWLADLPADWISPTAMQLDQFHGKLRISEVARDPNRAARWWAWVTEHNLSALSRSIEAFARRGAIDPEAGRALFEYLAGGIDAFHTYVGLQEAGHSPQMAPRGSGAMEHNVDLIVARRFKRQGMRAWSRKGADNLLAQMPCDGRGRLARLVG